MQQTFIKVPIKTVLTGVQYGTSSIKHFPQNIKIVGMKDLSDGKVLTNNLFLGDIPKNTIEQFKLKKGDILLNRTNSYELVGKVGIYDSDETAVFASYLVRLNVMKEKIDSYFLNYFLNLSSTQKEIRKIVTRAIGQANINPSQFIRHCMIPDIPLPEQERIAEILGAWDLAIEKLEALIAAKRLRKKGLMQKLLTAKIRLPGFTDEWQKAKLGEIASIVKGEQLGRLEMTESGIYPVINGGILKSGFTDSYNREKNTITISEGGNSCGFVAFVKERFWCGGHCYALSNLKTDLHFLFQILKFSESNIMRLRVGSGLPNIQKSSLDNFLLHIPTDVSEQKAIADILSKADEEIDLLVRKLDLLKSQKKGLMQQLLTGKIRVKIN